MKTFSQLREEILSEGNTLQQRVNKHVTHGVSIGAVSPERSEHSPEQKKKGHAEIKKDLESARKSGHIGGWSGPHKGQYKYAEGEHDVANEGSYIVHAAGNTAEHHKKMVSALSKIGNKHGQESVLSVGGKSKSAKWHHLSSSPKSGETESQGKLKYNKPLETGGGRTKLKGSSQSFTSE